MRFVIDAQVPEALARWLTDRGHDAEHVRACGLAAASDSAIWRYAVSTDAVIVTKDEDFARRRMTETDGPAVVWLRIRNTRRRELIVSFASASPDLLEALERGETLVEIIRPGRS